MEVIWKCSNYFLANTLILTIVTKETLRVKYRTGWNTTIDK